jgi:hypothetical protein
MAPMTFLPDLKFDRDVAESPDTTPKVAQPSLWTFLHPFDPKSWPSAVASVTSKPLFYTNRDHLTDS